MRTAPVLRYSSTEGCHPQGHPPQTDGLGGAGTPHPQAPPTASGPLEGGALIYQFTSNRALVVATAALLAIFVEARPLAAAVIEMKRDVSVDHNIIRLADVATVYDALPEEREALETVYVTLSPAAGQAKTVALDDVRGRLRAQGVNLGTIILEGPLATTVRRTAARGSLAARETPRSALTDLVTAFVAQELGREAAEVEVAFDGVTARRLDRLATAGLRFAVTRAGDAPLALGPNGLVLLGYEGREVRDRLSIAVQVKAYSPVPVAGRTIARGQTLTAGDIVVERRLSDDAAAAALTPADLVGRRAQRAVPQGAAIEPEMVADVPLVRRGDVVTVIARAPNIQVKTLGVALEDGAARQTIKVRNVDSRKVLAVVVEAPRTVVLDVNGGQQ